MLKMMFIKCFNSPQTGGEEGLFYSQLPKLTVGAPTDTSWTPRAHGGLDPVGTGVPCARYEPVHMGPHAHGGQKTRAHGVPRTACSSPLKHA